MLRSHTSLKISPELRKSGSCHNFTVKTFYHKVEILHFGISVALQITLGVTEV